MESSALVPVLSYILSKMVERNDKIHLDDSKRTVFHAQKSPIISLHRYLERVLSFAPCSKSCFIIALIYIDRIIQTKSEFILNSLSVHRMLITSVMVATKFFDDETFNNLYYAKVGGLQVVELNQLERKFLELIDFTFTIKSEVYERYYAELVKHVSASSSTCPKSQSLRTKLSHELQPVSFKPSIQPLSKSTNSLVKSPPAPVVACAPLPKCQAPKAPVVIAPPVKQPQPDNYESGFDYTARDMLPSSNESSTSKNVNSTTLDFGNLTVSGIKLSSATFPVTNCAPNYTHHIISSSLISSPCTRPLYA